MGDIYEIHYHRLGLALLEKAREFDKADLDEAVGEDGLRAEVLQDFIERRIDRHLTPETVAAIDASTQNPDQCDATELGRVLQLLLTKD